MKLDKELCLGIHEINAQHEALLNKISEVESMFNAGSAAAATQRTVVELVAIVKEHFAFEESLMRKHGYPKVDEHQEDHARIFVELEKIANRSFSAGTECDVLDLLRNYFVRHMLHGDKDYAEFILHGSLLEEDAVADSRQAQGV